jgi:hypothetical protein
MLPAKHPRDDGGDAAWIAKRVRPDHADLHRFLVRHGVICTPGTGRELDNNSYFSSRCLVYDTDRERGLFRTYNCQTGTVDIAWDRCQYALSARVDFHQQHRADCTGAPVQPALTLVGQALQRCGCPFTTYNRRPVWLVYPKDKTVCHVDGRVIENGLSEGQEVQCRMEDRLSLDYVNRHYVFETRPGIMEF